MKDNVTKPEGWRGFDDEMMPQQIHLVPDTIEVVTKRDVSLELVGHLLCSAWEGGSNFWASAIDSNKEETDAEYTFEVPLKANGWVKMLDMESDTEYNLSIKEIKNGLNLMAAKYPKHMNDLINENFDAITGDVFLQCCVLGDVIYG